jgi:N utilization substance protein B
MRQRVSSRHQARELAFQAVYALSFTDAANQPGDAAAFADFFTALPRAEKERKLTSKAETFARELAEGVWRETDDLSELVSRFSQNWKVARIARTDLAILRLGLFELTRRGDVPVKVAINEAVELAKEYGDDNSPGFINGILDAAARAIAKGALVTIRSQDAAPDKQTNPS